MEDNNAQETKETEQQKVILKEMVDTLSNMASEKEKTFKQLDAKCETQSRKLKELEQEKIIQTELSRWEKKNAQRVKMVYLLVATITISASVGFFVNLYNTSDGSLSKTSPPLLNNYNSNYVIQDLRGDTVNTWVSWNIHSDRILHIDIINNANLSQEKISVVKDAILSTKSISIDDSFLHKGPAGTSSLYYSGWQGALSAAAVTKTELYIPKKFDISETPDVSGDIAIILTNDVNPDGYSGYTKSLADGNEILKSKITIYSASELSASQLEAITRHEFGHAMGLAHSTAPEDLMHATIQTDYPYISGCDIDAIVSLYNGAKTSQVVCQK